MEESLPNIKGTLYGIVAAGDSTNSEMVQLIRARTFNWLGSGSYFVDKDYFISANNSSSTYQDNAHVRPLSIVTAFLIRY